MSLRYTYEMEDGFFVGYLDDYPEYPTQGENLKDFEENLLDIYNMIRDGTLETAKRTVFWKWHNEPARFYQNSWGTRRVF